MVKWEALVELSWNDPIEIYITDLGKSLFFSGTIDSIYNDRLKVKFFLCESPVKVKLIKAVTVYRVCNH